MTTAPIILNLLTNICASEYSEIAVINKLNDRYNFDHNVILLDRYADINRFISVGRQVPLIPQSLFVHKDSPTRWNNLKEIESKNPFTIVGLGKFSPKRIRKKFDRLLNSVKNIQRLNLNMKIGLFFADSISENDLLELFKWFFQRRIISIFAVCYGSKSTMSINDLNVLAFNPFGTFRVLNVTDTDYDNLFLSQSSDFQQYPLNITYSGRIYIDPLVRSLFESMNASYNEVYYDGYASINDDTWNNNFLENSSIDFNTNGVDPIRAEKVIIYPIFKDKTVMIVPKSKPYPEFLAYFQLLTSTYVFVYIIVTVALIIGLLTLIRYKNDKSISIFKSGSDILYLLMNENGFITYQLRSLSEVCLLVPLTFAGFLFVNGFMSILQSYLVQPVMQPQINTFEDIYKSDLIIYPESDEQMTVLDNMFRKLTTYKGPEEVAPGGSRYNGFLRGMFSGIFPESENFWKQKEEAEEKLGVRGFHVSKVYVDESLYTYRVNDAFPFADRMNDIISRLQCAGLIERWTQFTAAAPFTDDVPDRDKLLRKEVIFHYISPPGFPSREEMMKKYPDTWKEIFDKHPSLFAAKTEDDLADFPMFVFYGWGVSAVVFLMEIFFHFLVSKILPWVMRRLAAGLMSTKRGFQLVKKHIFQLLRKL